MGRGSRRKEVKRIIAQEPRGRHAPLGILAQAIGDKENVGQLRPRPVLAKEILV